jgi:hypothetical protein
MSRLKTLDERIKNNDLPPPAEYKTPEEVFEAYTSGKEQGAIYDPTGQEKIQAEAESMGFGDAEQVARAGGFEGQGKGKLILAYKNAWDLAGTEKAFRSFPNQICGDCVAHSNRNALVLAVANAAADGVGSFPSDMEDDWKTGGFLTSCNWWLRGYNGSGWSCGKALSCSKTIGLVVSKKYAGSVNMDLSVYNKSTNGAYGSKSPPSDMVAELGVNTVKAYTRLSDKGFEIIEDFLSSGAAISSCGNEGWSKSRDEWGFSKRSGSWAHALAIVGSDSTPEAIQRYGEPLLLIQNSWATWNGSDPRHCHGDASLPRQPVGSFWAKYSDAKKRDMYAVQSVASFPNRKLKNWDLSDLV